jgi:nucleoside-diphosphate-sugar epimerase
MKILITGCSGYIGSFLTTKLLSLGYKVFGIDLNLFSSDSLNHLFINKNFSFLNFDVRNKNKLKKIIKKVDIIIPLAAIVGAPLCDKNKKDAITTNLEIIKYICKIKSKNQKIIFPTTNSGYGIGKKNEYCDEDTPLKPISLYGRTKVEAEKVILATENSLSFRLATVFGYSYRMRTDLLVNHLVLLAHKKKKIEIFEPHFRRNYIHVEDVANGFCFAIDNFTSMKNNSYNLGLSNANLTKLQLVKKIKTHVKDLKIKIIKNKKDPDKRDYFVSNKKIEKIGFVPKISLDQGIKELLKFYHFSKINIINNY